MEILKCCPPRPYPVSLPLLTTLEVIVWPCSSSYYYSVLFEVTKSDCFFNVNNNQGREKMKNTIRSTVILALALAVCVALSRIFHKKDGKISSFII